MLQAHSFLWHYLWLGPHILQLGICILIWRKGLYKLFPVFLTYAVFEALEEFLLYGLDLAPSVSNTSFWTVVCVGRVCDGFLKIAVIGELFRNLVSQWPSLAKLGNRLITGFAAVLVVLAVVAAAYTPIDNPQFAIVSRSHVIEQTFYIVQSGLVLFLFMFAAHFRLSWDGGGFGIALGFAVVVCEHMAAWAITASGAMIDQRHLLDLLNMATYHLCVMIWFYYFLVPKRVATKSVVSLPDNNLAIWNREL